MLDLHPFLPISVMASDMSIRFSRWKHPRFPLCMRPPVTAVGRHGHVYRALLSNPLLKLCVNLKCVRGRSVVPRFLALLASPDPPPFPADVDFQIGSLWAPGIHAAAGPSQRCSGVRRSSPRNAPARPLSHRMAEQRDQGETFAAQHVAVIFDNPSIVRPRKLPPFKRMSSTANFGRCPDR